MEQASPMSISSPPKSTKSIQDTKIPFNLQIIPASSNKKNRTFDHNL